MTSNSPTCCPKCRAATEATTTDWDIPTKYYTYCHLSDCPCHKQELSGATFEQKHEHSFEWEKEFDALFPSDDYGDFQIFDEEKIKSFIRKVYALGKKEGEAAGVRLAETWRNDAIKAERERILAALPKIKTFTPNEDGGCMNCGYTRSGCTCSGFNAALAAIRTAISGDV